MKKTIICGFMAIVSSMWAVVLCLFVNMNLVSKTDRGIFCGLLFYFSSVTHFTI